MITAKLILIFGYNEYAKEIALNFKHSHSDIYIYVINDNEYKNAKEDGFTVQLVDLDDDWTDIEKNFDISGLICFCSLNDDAENVFLTISLRSQYPNLNIVALATSQDSADKLKLAGANKTIAKLEATAHVIVESLEKPAVIDTMHDILYHNKDIRLAEFTVSKGSILENKRLNDITVNKEHNIIILAIADQEMDAEFTFTSAGHNHKIDADDVLVVIGKEKDLKNFEKAIK